ncbi:hypothetical protein [Spirosoma panaciterrae]|uniref:hypothetical protein n=1 Tax=Spirosoma panaciterrae TaxID=496058 RepID=UPI00035F118E|nr:hypothetical protein [Spirosoma panaciterrae]
MTLSTVLLAVLASFLFRRIWAFFFDDELVLIREVISLLLISIILNCSGCQPKTKVGNSAVIRVSGDANRIELKQTADGSAQAVQVAKDHSDSAKTQFKKDLSHYDSLQIDLP